jgi:hypothetical protein
MNVGPKIGVREQTASKPAPQIEEEEKGKIR